MFAEAIIGFSVGGSVLIVLIIAFVRLYCHYRWVSSIVSLPILL